MSYLRALVNELGSKTPDEIYMIMQAEGIKGLRHSPTKCPISNFLYRETGVRPVVAPYVILGVLSNGRSERIRVPSSVTEFIGNFDGEKYPELNYLYNEPTRAPVKVPVND